MNHFRFFAMATALWLSTGLAQAQECYVPIAIHIDGKNIPSEAVQFLENSLTRIATASDYEAGLGLSQFILTVRVDALDKSFHAGPPMQVTQNIGITFFIADTHSKTKFASAYVEVDGVGQNETKCFIDAFKRLNANHRDIQSLMQQGRKKILSFYDANYQSVLAEAKKQASLQKYEAAIALAISIPPCSKGGDAGLSAGLQYYTVYRNRQNQQILNRARSLWAAGQDVQTAREVAQLLCQIDPEAACYSDALKLQTDMKKQVRADIDFQMREKYHDQVKLRQQEVDAMKAIGVAYGKGQQPVTTNLMWLR